MEVKEVFLKGIRNRRYAQIEVNRCLSELHQGYPDNGSVSVWVSSEDCKPDSIRAVVRMQLYGKTFVSEAHAETVASALLEAKKLLLKQVNRSRERFNRYKRRIGRRGPCYALRSA